MTRYRLEHRPDGTLIIDTQEHRSVLLTYDQSGDVADEIQRGSAAHWANDLPLEPTARIGLCAHPGVLQAGLCCERSPCRLAAVVRVLSVVGETVVRPVFWVEGSVL